MAINNYKNLPSGDCHNEYHWRVEELYPYEQTGLRLRNGMLPIVDGHVWEAALRFLVSNLFDILMFCFDLLMFFWFPIFFFCFVLIF